MIDSIKELKRLNKIASKVRNYNGRFVRAAWILALFIVVVAGIDVISTNAAIAVGHTEGNPVVKDLQDNLGVWWSAPKIGFHLLLALLVLWLPSRKMVSMARVVVGGYLAIIFNNFYFAGWLI